MTALLGRLTGQGAPPPRPRGPLLSEVIEPFLAEKTPRKGADGRRDRDGDRDAGRWTPGTCVQSRAIYKMWLDLMGDRPVEGYTARDADAYRDLLRLLPASYGKARSRLPPREAIARAEADRQRGQHRPGLTEKTIKKHFAALGAVWKWLIEPKRAHVEKNIFRGFVFHGTGSSKKKRNDWSASDLAKIFYYNKWFGAGADRGSAYFWLPLIALFSGMRVEEIAHLRVADVRREAGILIFDIRDHEEDGWSPKSEAGERWVPVHTRLLELGFEDFLRRRQASGEVQLFGDLTPGGPDAKFSYAYSREFSRVKRMLGVSNKTTFHSFRHTVRTILEGIDIEERWLDGVLGHARPHASEGSKTYRKRWGGRPLRRHLCARIAVSKSLCRGERPWVRLPLSAWIWRRTLSSFMVLPRTVPWFSGRKFREARCCPFSPASRGVWWRWRLAPVPIIGRARSASSATK